MTINDAFNLQRFVDAQNPLYEQVRAELGAGNKTSHWMWFIFPQIVGLGESYMAQMFAISGRDEAAAYLQHPVLGPRLRECTRLVNEVAGRSIEHIFGGIDAMKFRSSMTLFAKVAEDNQLFLQALKKYCDGKMDELTLAKL